MAAGKHHIRWSQTSYHKSIIDNVIINPNKPVINWTDNDFISAGNVVFTIGTKNSKHSAANLNHILKWRYNTATGSLQYTFDLGNIGVGAKDDNGNTEWFTHSAKKLLYWIINDKFSKRYLKLLLDTIYEYNNK